MPMLDVLSAIDDVAAAEQRGIASETAAGDRANDRHLAVEARRASQIVVVSRPAGVGRSSPGRPPPPSANRMTGIDHLSASDSSRSFFLWLMTPCVPANTV